jgi:hypothetical protein
MAGGSGERTTKKAARGRRGRRESDGLATSYGGITRVRFEGSVSRVERSQPAGRRAPLSDGGRNMTRRRGFASRNCNPELQPEAARIAGRRDQQPEKIWGVPASRRHPPRDCLGKPYPGNQPSQPALPPKRALRAVEKRNKPFLTRENKGWVFKPLRAAWRRLPTAKPGIRPLAEADKWTAARSPRPDATAPSSGCETLATQTPLPGFPLPGMRK